MEVTVKEAANKKSSLRFPSLPDKEIRVKGNAKYQKYELDELIIRVPNKETSVVHTRQGTLKPNKKM